MYNFLNRLNRSTLSACRFRRPQKFVYDEGSSSVTGSHQFRAAGIRLMASEKAGSNRSYRRIDGEWISHSYNTHSDRAVGRIRAKDLIVIIFDHSLDDKSAMPMICYSTFIASLRYVAACNSDMMQSKR